MEGERSGIFGSSNRTGEDQNEGRKDKRCIEIADFKRSERHTEILSTCQLLSAVY